MEISRNVILDLLPLYLAGELSEESRALVQKHLANDPQLAKLAKLPEAMELSEKIPVPLTQNDELVAYKRAKQAIMWRTIAIGVVIAIFLLLVLAMFFFSSSPSDSSQVSVANEGTRTTLIDPRVTLPIAAEVTTVGTWLPPRAMPDALAYVDRTRENLRCICEHLDRTAPFSRQHGCAGSHEKTTKSLI